METRRTVARWATFSTLLLVLASAGGVPPATAGNVYFVAPGGSDAAPGSASEPWATVERGLVALEPGDTLYLRGGVYRERIQHPSIRSGTADARVLVAAYPGERPVIQGLLWLKGPSYWTLEGINVTWDSERNSSKEHMVKLTNGVGWELRHSELWDANGFAALLVASTVSGEPADWRVVGNCIHHTHPSNDTNQDHNIYVNSGLDSGPGLIEGNLLFAAPNGENLKLGGPNSSSGGTANLTVRYNTLYGAAQNILVAWSSHHNVFERNLVVEATGQDNYRPLRGYDLDNWTNLAQDNAWFDAQQDALVLNYPGDGGGIQEGTGNFEADPAFDRVDSCGGFRPGNAQVAGYGHLAVNTQVVADGHLAESETPAEQTAADDTFIDIEGSPFEDDIRWLAAEGITSGCSTNLFCPDDPVSRGQMATFLRRGFDLPEGSDYFWDDQWSIFEEHINAVAAAEVTKGCGDYRFCPKDAVTRGQMATFLSRALNLPPVSQDYFSDDEGSMFEEHINAAAAAGLTKGCGDGRFCPNDAVTRAQMAALLRRALSS